MHLSPPTHKSYIQPRSKVMVPAVPPQTDQPEMLQHVHPPISPPACPARSPQMLGLLCHLSKRFRSHEVRVGKEDRCSVARPLLGHEHNWGKEILTVFILSLVLASPSVSYTSFMLVQLMLGELTIKGKLPGFLLDFATWIRNRFGLSSFPTLTSLALRIFER